jgi:hypothetical protein
MSVIVAAASAGGATRSSPAKFAISARSSGRGFLRPLMSGRSADATAPGGMSAMNSRHAIRLRWRTAALATPRALRSSATSHVDAFRSSRRWSMHFLA